jgi:hypothetical protein
VAEPITCPVSSTNGNLSSELSFISQGFYFCAAKLRKKQEKLQNLVFFTEKLARFGKYA